MGTARMPTPVMILTGAAVMMSIGMGMRQSLGLFLQPVTQTSRSRPPTSPSPSRYKTSPGAWPRRRSERSPTSTDCVPPCSPEG